ncbi:MAG: uracil-DNA glycosylase family protein [Myxococcota bacterium]
MLDEILAGMAKQARLLKLPVDEAAYARAGRSPRAPIACAGTPRAPICFLGRDLGRREVEDGQPLVGPAGRLVRQTVLEVAGEPLRHAFLTNLVPYKPAGNRAFSARAVEGFRPLLEQLLLVYWKGRHVFALGREATRWFSRYVDGGEAASLWNPPRCFEHPVSCTLRGQWHGRRKFRRLLVHPLPHPSPANALWQARLPALLRRQLRAQGLFG